MVGTLESLPQTFSYNADGTTAYVEVTDGTDTWRQTWEYAGGVLSGVSFWVKQ